MADLNITPDQIAKAREAGYSDDEIVNHLSTKAPEKFKGALDAGYSPTEILAHFGAAAPATAPQPTNAAAPEDDTPHYHGMLRELTAGAFHGVNEMIRGAQSSRKNVMGTDVDDAPLDPDYKPASVTNGSWNPLKWNGRQLPRMVGEMAPLAATSSLGAAVGSLAGPAGAVAGGLAPIALTSAGDNVKHRAVARTGDPNATPDALDKTIGIGTTLAAAVPASIMHTPALGNAVGAGLGGVAQAGANLLTRGAVGAAGGVAQNAITQAGTKIGTDQPFDPSQLPEAAVGGAASVTPHLLPTVAAGARALRMGKYNADPEAAANYATRLQNTGLDLNDIHEAAQAHQKVMSDTHGELKAALDKVVQQKALSPEETNAVASIRRGDQITPKDMEHLTTATAGAPDGANAHFLARALNTAQQAQGEGSFDPKTGWQGSATGGMKNVVRGVFNPWHIGGTMAGLGALAFGMPHVSGAVGGGLMGGLGIGLGGARLLDSVTGGSRPAANFAKTFADHNAQLRMSTAPPPAQPQPAPQAPNAPWGPRPPTTGPTGPQVAPPGAPPAPPPQFNPMAMSMLKKQLATPLPGAPPAPAPAAPQAPQFNPMALQMLKQKLKTGLPPEPQPEATPPPAPPAKPDISPMALAMLQKKLKAGLPAPEAPPAEAPPAAPAAPEFNPTALAMLKQKMKAGLPPEPGVANAKPAPAMKISKSNGKVKTEAPEAEAPKAEASAPFEPLDEAQLYPADISAKAYAVHEASAYGASSPKYLAKAEHSAQKRIDAEHKLVSQFPESSHAIKGLVRQLHKIGSNAKERNKAVDHYSAFLSPEASSAVQSAFK